ncbi:MAG: ClpX C4-type zinc finger protein, partial [Byssovorax sp.]
MAWLQDLFGKKAAAAKAGIPLDPPAHAPGADAACSFCGLPRTSVKYLISAPRNIFICETCVTDCVGVLESQGSHDPVESTRDFVLRQLRGLEQPADLSTSRRLVEAALALAAGDPVACRAICAVA